MMGYLDTWPVRAMFPPHCAGCGTSVSLEDAVICSLCRAAFCTGCLAGQTPLIMDCTLCGAFPCPLCGGVEDVPNEGSIFFGHSVCVPCMRAIIDHDREQVIYHYSVLDFAERGDLLKRIDRLVPPAYRADVAAVHDRYGVEQGE